MDWKNASDEELLKQLQDSHRAAIISHSDEWAIVHEAIRRIREKYRLALEGIDPTDTKKVMKLQILCQFYGEDFLPRLIRDLKLIGEVAVGEADERGILEDFLAKVSKSL